MTRPSLFEWFVRVWQWLQCVWLLKKPLLTIPAYDVAPPQPKERLVAGAAAIDITPPPGFPMGGSSVAAKFGRGYWTRLYARAFFFRDKEGQSLALVSCDLNAMPGGLPARVGWLLRNAGLNLTPENLILAATHIHQGPGNFFSYKLYNDRGSPAPGYDAELFDRLARRIAAAIVEAANSATADPAANARLVLRSGRIPDLLRNRAPMPFLLNSDREDVLRAGPAGPFPSCPEPFPDECPRYRAVDESLTVLEIHRDSSSGSKQIASLVFLSVHPEAMSHETALYQSDFTGLAMATLEKKQEIVAGFFNGADGDISVRWERQNRNETVDLASKLVAAIERLSPGQPLGPDVRVLVARREIVANPYFGSKSEGWCTERPYGPDRPRLCLAATPLFGVAAIGGAEDARTPLHELGWREGVRTLPRDRQGVKVGAFESVLLPGVNLTSLLAPACFYPDSFSVSLASLRGSEPSATVSFSVLPGELTRTMWWRVKNALEAASGGLGRILPLGLANDYIAYVTTPEEYGAQGYEGASNIFGPATGDVLREVSCDLVRLLHPPVTKTFRVAKRRFYPGWKTESFGPEWLGIAYSDSDEGLEPLLVDDRYELLRHWKQVPYRHWPRFEWCEPRVDPWLATGRRVTIRRAADHRVVDDELAGNVLTVFLNPPVSASEARMRWQVGSSRFTTHGVRHRPARRSNRSEGLCWTAIWIWPSTMQRNEELYFRVDLATGAGSMCSIPFTIDDVETRPSPIVPPAQCLP